MVFFEESEHCKTELQSENPVRNGGVFICHKSWLSYFHEPGARKT